MREVGVAGEHARVYTELFESSNRVIQRCCVAFWEEFDAKIDCI